jgi:hypothetical protein
VQADAVAINWKERAILAGACTWGTDAVDRPTVRHVIARTIPLTMADLPEQGAGWQSPGAVARVGAMPVSHATLEAAGGIVIDLSTLFADLAE